MALSTEQNATPIQLLRRFKAYTPQFFDKHALYVLYDHPVDTNCRNIVTLSHRTVINYFKYSPEC